MAIRELIRRGYWNQAGEADAGGAGNTDDDAGHETDTGSHENDKSLSDEVFEALHGEDQDDTGADDTDAGKQEEVTSSLPEDQKQIPPADDKDPKAEGKNENTDDTDDPYKEPEGFDNLAQKTQERFKSLVNMNKEKDTQIEQMGQTIQGFVGMVRETGANDDQLIQMLDIAKLVYHPQQSDPKKAVENLYSMAQQVARDNGVPLPGYDPLEGHPDLKRQVEDREITQDAAEETARLRNQQKTQEQRTEQQRNQQQQRQQVQQRFNQGKTAVQDFLVDKQKNDIDFPAKAQHLMKYIDGVSQNLPPEQWVAELERLYTMVSDLLPNQPKPNNDNGGDDTPLRSSGGAGGKKAPGNMAEAVANGLGIQV